MTEEELVNGCLGDGHEDTDWQLTEGEIEGLPELVIQDTLRYDYNQGKQSWSKKSCSIFSAISAMSDLMNYEYGLDEIKEIDDKSYLPERGRKQGEGWYVKKAFMLVLKDWNEKHPDRPVAMYTIRFDDDEKCNYVMEKNYNLGVSFDYTEDYVKDFGDNGAIDRAVKGSKKLVGHCVNEIIKYGRKMIKDNYKGSSSQYYQIKVKNNDLFVAGIFHTRAYLYTKVGENNLSELKRFEKVKTAALNALEANSALWHETNSQEVKDKLHETNETIRNVILKYIETMTTKLRNDL